MDKLYQPLHDSVPIWRSIEAPFYEVTGQLTLKCCIAPNGTWPVNRGDCLEIFFTTICTLFIITMH